MSILAGVLGALIIVAALIEVFETIVLPRRVTRRLRVARLLYQVVWEPWRWAARLAPARRRKSVLSVFGPLALLLLLAIWTFGLILGFALLQWANGSDLRAPEGHADFGVDLYFSASTLFTLGLGDVVPRDGLARLLAMLEAAGGFGILALVIGYLPALYQAFSRREIAVSLLDARAGSPPSAGELLRRYAENGLWADLDIYLKEWESWASELMESHLSYPMLAYFRSQHDNQSWLAALTTILDCCAFIAAALPDAPRHTARLTFAMCRHAAVDLAQVFDTPPHPPPAERLSVEELARLCADLAGSGVRLAAPEEMAPKLARLRAAYEPYVHALAHRLALSLPPWLAPPDVSENWRSTAWESRGGTLF